MSTVVLLAGIRWDKRPVVWGMSLIKVVTGACPMQLYQRICAACDGLVCLQNPPPLKRNFWEHYRKFDVLLDEHHTAALHLLEEQYVDNPTVSYETPVPQAFLDMLLLQGGRSMMSLDRDLRGLIETADEYYTVEGYLNSLTLLRENVGLTLKHYGRLKGSATAVA